MKVFMALSALCCAVPSLPASAQSDARNPFDPSVVTRGFSQLAGMVAHKAMEEADVNRDGAITYAEAVRASERYSLPFNVNPEVWHMMDLNGDGVLSEREIADFLRGVQSRTSHGMKPF